MAGPLDVHGLAYALHFSYCYLKFATCLIVCFTTISSHFSTNYMNIFHKTEVLLVILRCWKGLKLNWFKSYDTNPKKKKTQKAKSKKRHKTKKTSISKGWKTFIPNLKTCFLQQVKDIITTSSSYQKNRILKSWWEWQPSLPHPCPLKHRHFTS